MLVTAIEFHFRPSANCDSYRRWTLRLWGVRQWHNETIEASYTRFAFGWACLWLSLLRVGKDARNPVGERLAKTIQFERRKWIPVGTKTRPRLNQHRCSKQRPRESFTRRVSPELGCCRGCCRKRNLTQAKRFLPPEIAS